MTDKELQELIRLKRYEQPEEGYFEDFLQEFQQRQRSEMLRTSARGLFVERVKARFAELGAMRWVIGAGAAYAAVALVIKTAEFQTFAPLDGAAPIAANANIEVKPDLSLASLSDDSMSAEAILNSDFTVSNYQEMDDVGLTALRPVDFTTDGPSYLEEGSVL